MQHYDTPFINQLLLRMFGEENRALICATLADLERAAQATSADSEHEPTPPTPPDPFARFGEAVQREAVRRERQLEAYRTAFTDE